MVSCSPFCVFGYSLSVSGAAGATAGSASRASKINAGINLESRRAEINFHRSRLLEKIGFCNKGMTANGKNFIFAVRLIQSQGQRRPGSAARVDKKPEGHDLPPFKIGIDLLNGSRSHFDHKTSFNNGVTGKHPG